MSMHLKRQANLGFALAAVGVLAALLLKDMGLWKLLIPVWLVAWVVVQIGLQHVATRPLTQDSKRRWPDAATVRRCIKSRDAVG